MAQQVNDAVSVVTARARVQSLTRELLHAVPSLASSSSGSQLPWCELPYREASGKELRMDSDHE